MTHDFRLVDEEIMKLLVFCRLAKGLLLDVNLPCKFSRIPGYDSNKNIRSKIRNPSEAYQGMGLGTGRGSPSKEADCSCGT